MSLRIEGGRGLRYAADQKEKTRARIVGAAGRVFRRDGYHASGVDKVMAEAGLTAGGLTAHFDSKKGSWPRRSSMRRPRLAGSGGGDGDLQGAIGLSVSEPLPE